MRPVLSVVLVALCAAPASAQSLYQRDGGTGFGLFASYVPAEGGRTVGAGGVASVLPGLDLAVDVARVTDGEPTDDEFVEAVTAVGGSVAFYPVRTRGTRIGLSLGAVRLSDDDESETVGAGGLVAGHQFEATPAVTFVPQVSFVVPFSLGEAGGAGFSAAATPALMLGTADTRFVFAPALTYGFDTQETTPSFTAGLVTSL